jgi:hypothetical protein
VTKVIKDLIWKAGKNILSGQFSDLMKMGTPAYVHQHRSYLHMVTKDICYYEHFVREAMKHPDDPVWKLKNLIMAMLAALHLNSASGSKSPLNPILGETLVEQSVAGTMMYCEQTSHHPPISNFLIEGPPDCPFRFYGHVEYKVQVKGAFSMVHISMPGRVTIDLPDGSKYTAEYPMMEVEGLMSTAKVLNVVGSLTIRDLTKNYLLEVDFDSLRDQRRSGLIGFFTKKPDMIKNGSSPHRRDLLHIEISKIDEHTNAKERVAFAAGSYLEEIKYEGEEHAMWSIN